MASKRRRSEIGQTSERRVQKGKSSKGNRTRAEQQRRNQRRRKQGLSTGKKILVGICIVLLIFVLTAIVGVAYLGSKMNKLDTKDLDLDKLSISDELQYDETGYLNVALFGLDARATDESMGARSDTIIIASLNRETKVVKMVSVYRDTLLRLNDGDYYKANAAYAYGKEEEAVAMLNRNLDMNITHYVTVDFSALVDVIDAVGGIEIDVTQEEVEGVDGYNINGYIMEIMENTGKESIGVTEPGLQLLNGTQATAYARIRFTSGSDFTRSERQRLVLTKLAEKLQSSSLSTLDKIIDNVFSKVGTNFTMTEILAYAKDIKKYQFGESQGFPLNVDNVSYSDQGSCVISTTMLDDVVNLHRYLFGEDGYTPTSTVTEISNELQSIYNTGGTGSSSGYNTYDYSYNSGYSDSSNYYGSDGNTYDDTGSDYSGDYSDTTIEGDTGYDNSTGGEESGW